LFSHYFALDYFEIHTTTITIFFHVFSTHVYIVLFIISILYIVSEMTSVKEQPSVRLKNAVHGEVLMPVVGLGTGGYGQPDGSGGEYWGTERGHNATVAWLKMGGRRIDTSNDYASRDGIGTGWIASGVPRSEIFITSKVNAFGYDEALEELDGILKSLQTDYIDLLLIHWPGLPPSRSGKPTPCKNGQSTWAECRIQTWRALETIFKQKLVRCSFHCYRS
jgi:diketogulonate reductase-like aldo/keto reductase